jgi:hypothetical protein
MSRWHAEGKFRQSENCGAQNGFAELSEAPRFDDWLPRNRLPPTYFPKSTQLDWFDMDTFENFKARSGHPIYGEHDIQYSFNALGYRSPEFEHLADVRVIAVGCSYVMGVGLPQNALFHYQFGERLQAHSGRSVVVWNLGSVGASNDYIARMLQLAVPVLDPHILLVNFTHASRREYVSVQNRLVPYNPGWEPHDLVNRAIKKQFLGLSSPYDDRVNLFRNYRAIEPLLCNRCWLFSSSDPEALAEIAEHVDKSRYVGVLGSVDKARDGAHPGPQSHTDLALLYWNRFLTLNK